MLNTKVIARKIRVIDFSSEKGENLEKALLLDIKKANNLNTARLVQKRVPVKGKDGKIFYRMQWVKPHEDDGSEEGKGQETIPQNSLGDDSGVVGDNLLGGENSTSEEVRQEMKESFLSKDTDEKYEEYSDKAEEDTSKDIQEQAESLYINVDVEEDTSMDDFDVISEEEEDFLFNDKKDALESIESMLKSNDSAQQLFEDNTLMRGWVQEYEDQIEMDGFTGEFIPEGDIASVALQYGMEEELLPSLRWLAKQKKPDYEGNARNLRFRKIDYTLNTLYTAFAANITGMTKAVKKACTNTGDGIDLTFKYDKRAKNDDEYTGYVRYRCIREQFENTEYEDYYTISKAFTVLGSHPGVLRFTLDSIWGKEWHKQFKSDLAPASLCITVDSANASSILKKGYEAGTPEKYLEKMCIANKVEPENIKKAKKALKEVSKTDSMGDFSNVFAYKIKNEMGTPMAFASYDILDSLKSRYLAERGSSGIKMDDPKPSYIFFNSTGSDVLDFYGNHNIEVDESVLKNCVVCMDDSFNESGTVPMARSMDNLKELFILRGTLNHGSDMVRSIRENDSDWSGFAGGSYNIPLELQYYTHSSGIDKSLLMDTDY